MLPTAMIDLPYASFDEYLGAMRAQYRRRVRQTFKRSSELRIEHRAQFAELAGELARLWRLIYDRATEVKREILTPAFFAAASELEETSVLLTRRDDGSIASFALLLSDGPWLSFLHCGFDLDVARSEGAYFRLLYEIVRVAIEGGFDQVELGMTTLQPKLDIGAVPVPLYACLKHRNPLVQRALGAVGNRVIRPEHFEPRKVFKDPPPSAGELVARRMSAPHEARPDAHRRYRGSESPPRTA
jgi:predicted N-acyltransferase